MTDYQAPLHPHARALLGLDALKLLNPSITGDGAGEIFRAIPRNIGIGCIFTAGLISILKMSKVITTALKEALGGLLKGGAATHGSHDRTDEDISYPMLLVIGAITAAAIFLYFRFMVMANLENATSLSVLALVLALVVAFLFTTVSAWAIATISVTPISGMSVTTIIITAARAPRGGPPEGGRGDADRPPRRRRGGVRALDGRDARDRVVGAFIFLLEYDCTGNGNCSGPLRIERADYIGRMKERQGPDASGCAKKLLGKGEKREPTC